ncbi:hypothetical protein MSAN_01857300 [Mycena sanguinolenta]|uniref:Uncharacterized protein n=1 Tax=Mycena sanguinolenta TaxID=230812 RepID=A0A8H7CQB8_9AGAR|nr:hypothetical protein MSAN_01857300 [Mycena sanguinolenta]
MAPRPWATDEQQEWLQCYLAEFVRRQAEKKLALFWPILYAAWFRRFPEHTVLGLPLPTDLDARKLTKDELARVGTAVEARQNQLENWFWNNRAKINKGSGALSVKSEAMVAALLDVPSKPKKRVHHAVEIFQRRNRELIKRELTVAGYDKLSDQEDDEDDWTDESDGSEAAQVKSLKSLRMRMRTRVVADLWKEAPAEERAIVLAELEQEKEEMRQERAEMKAKAEAKASGSNEEVANTGEQTPAELQQGIDGLEAFLSKVLGVVYKGAKWVGMTLVGGPNPRMGGELSMKVICHGTTPAGIDFEDFCVDFDKHVVESFEGFLQQVYTPEECRTRALDVRALETNDPARPATVIHAPSPAQDTPPTVQAKRKRRKNKKTAATAATSPPAPASSPMVPDSVEGSESVNGNNSSVLAPTTELAIDVSNNLPRVSTNSSPNMERGESATSLNVEYDPLPFHGEDDIAYERERSPFPEAFRDGNIQHWPPGMSSPLSPATAAELARLERGGASVGPTMAATVIDPQLLPPNVFATSLPERPHPKPAYRGAVSQSISAPPPTEPVFRLSGLFEALRHPTPPPRPSPSTPFFTLPASYAPQPRSTDDVHGRVPVVAPTPRTPTVAARVLSALISPPQFPENTTPQTSISKTAPTASASPAPPVSAAPPVSSAPSISPAPPISPATPVSPVPPISPAPPLASAKSLFIPESRPALRPPTDESVKKTRKPTAARKTASKTNGSKRVAKQVAAEQAHGVAVASQAIKKRGRPSKAEKAAMEAAALVDVTNQAISSNTLPVPIYTTTNNNRAAAKRAAEEAKAAERKAADDARAAQREKGWEPGPVEGTVILLRGRKPRLHADGSLPQRVVKGTRAPQLDKSEKALLPRVQSGGKRKAIAAPASSKEPSKKKSKK